MLLSPSPIKVVYLSPYCCSLSLNPCTIIFFFHGSGCGVPVASANVLPRVLTPRCSESAYRTELVSDTDVQDLTGIPSNNHGNPAVHVVVVSVRLLGPASIGNNRDPPEALLVWTFTMHALGLVRSLQQQPPTLAIAVCARYCVLSALHSL